MGKRGPKKRPDVRTPADLDPLDLQIIAILEVNPGIGCPRIAGELTESGTPTGASTVWDRLQRIRKSDWVEQMRKDLKELGGKILRSLDEGMEYGERKDRAAIAIRILQGLGVLVDKKKIELTGDDKTFVELPTEEKAAIVQAYLDEPDPRGGE